MESSETKFTWVQTHSELVQYLAGKENEQKELIELLKDSGATMFNDRDESGNIIELEEIDPFTFFCYIHKYGDERRIKIFKHLSDELGLPVPDNFSGIPSTNALRVWLYPYKKDRTNNEINRLWALFRSAINGSVSDEKFKDILMIDGVGHTKITEVLFYIMPETYFPINSPVKPYLKEVFGIDPKFKTWTEYLNILEQIKEKTKKPFYEISYEAWAWNEETKKGETEMAGSASKWNELVDVVLNIDDEAAVRKFFKFLQRVLQSLESNGKEEVIYSSAIGKYIQLMMGSRYVSKIEKKRVGTRIGYYIQESFLQDLKVSYSDIIISDKVKDVDGNPMIWVEANAGEVKPDDFMDAALAVAKTGFTGQTKSQYHAIHQGVHNSWIAQVALKDSLLEKLLGGEKMTEPNIKPEVNYPLNTIFYGPPGTGKTYNTIKRAAEIVEGRVIEDYGEAKQVFNNCLGKTIEFITFHQNYSYEDFIQGLRPETEGSDSLTFEKRDGTFKKIADRAYRNLLNSRKNQYQLNKTKAFINALENLKDEILETDIPVPINETAYFVAVEEDAFRYSADNWTLKGKGFTGFRMKYSDLVEFFEAGIESRKEIKELDTISGLAKQHASYFFKTYEIVKERMDVSEAQNAETEKKNYVLIIDEINRANISRVFGELITLIEPDKRSDGNIPLKAKLPSGDPFIVPSNLYLVGTMNTADKSIAQLDIALRRRFEFEAMYPIYELSDHGIYDVDVLKSINKKIIELKGHDFQIGHSYFMDGNGNLKERMNKKVIPLLMEYFMNDKKEVEDVLKSAKLEIVENSWPLRITGIKL